MFGGIDYYLTEIQYSTIEEVNNYYLNRMTFLGTMQTSEKNMIVEELESKGFKDIQIIATDGYNNLLDDSSIVVRDIENPQNSTLILEVLAKPKTTPFVFGRILGITEDNDFYFYTRGRSLSEVPMW